MSRSLPANRPIDSLTSVRTRANGVSGVGLAGNTADMLSDLHKWVPGRGSRSPTRFHPDQGQTPLPECIYAGQTANRGHAIWHVSPRPGTNPVTSDNASKERSS
jgi:hypothetical protein